MRENRVIKSKTSDIYEDFELEEITEEECKMEEENLRKTSILEKIPFEEWSKEELSDLIEEYKIYFIVLANRKNKKPILPISYYVSNGEYKRLLEWADEYRKE